MKRRGFFKTAAIAGVMIAAGIIGQQASAADTNLRTIWPIIFAVYLFNAMFVVMNYQFVNGYLFTLAGILSAQKVAMKQSAAPITR